MACGGKSGGEATAAARVRFSNSSSKVLFSRVTLKTFVDHQVPVTGTKQTPASSRAGPCTNNGKSRNKITQGKFRGFQPLPSDFGVKKTHEAPISLSACFRTLNSTRVHEGNDGLARSCKVEV